MMVDPAFLQAARAAARGDIHPNFSVSRLMISGHPLIMVVGRSVAAYRTALPPSLARIADAVARGLTDKDVASELNLPLATVRTYIQRLYGRLGVNNRVELARLWWGRG